MVSTKPTAESIFLAAIELPPDQRAAYLKDACGNDPELRARIERLLAAQSHAESFLESPAPELGATADHRVTEQPGTVIGAYKLIEQIGEGGFGVVFLAEQATPIRRRVALKIVKPGMDTRQVIARFDAERQALALMDHPGIAKVFDAGVTEQGRSYFVMELVQGIPITDYCDQCQLPTRERLELFIAVCQAVQHAHQKGIIHRDLKPTNILVALQDGRPVPKIIDFGVAKAIARRLTEHTLTTAFAQMVGTPLYMSPEQAELSPLGVDTRTDIYSLGVLLYELLSGTTPFEKDRLHAASYDELRRIIREEEPPRPSTRLSQIARSSWPASANPAEETTAESTGLYQRTTIAEHRRTDPRRLQRELHGDLDWIVMKCLEKDRNRRYESASSLADDVQRHLNDEPVQACPPSKLYKLNKFVRRNRTAAAFLALLMASAIGLAIGYVQIARERDAKAAAFDQTVIESARAKAVSDLLWATLASSFPKQAKDSEYTVRELLDDATAELTVHTPESPEVESAVRSMIGRSYWRLGMPNRADMQLRRALDLQRQTYGNKDERVADGLTDYCWNLGELGRFTQLQDCASEAAAIYHQLDASSRRTSSLAEVLFMTALSQLQTGDMTGYRATCSQLIELSIHSGEAMSNSRPVWPLCLAPNALENLERLVTRAKEYYAQNWESSPHYSHCVLGAALFRAGRHDEAVNELQKSIDCYPASPSSGFDTLNYQKLLLTMAQWKLGNHADARQLLAAIRPTITEELQASATKWVRRTSLELLLAEADALVRSKEEGEKVTKQIEP